MTETMRVGVEVGGTFTDLVAIGPGGVRVTKVPSNPAEPDIGAFHAVEESGLALGDIDELAHGSTVATNAVLERKGFPIAFLVTQGFRDILAMQRHNRTNIYDLEYRKPRPVVERKDTFEIDERLLADGSVEKPLVEAAVVERIVPKLVEGSYAAVAICLLNAYANPAHEARLARVIAEHCPHLLVTPSHEVTREFREYERASTTTLSAYVQPVIDRYIGRFVSRLEEGGFTGRFSLMQSNGGRLPAEGMRRNAITALLSGPAAGVMGAARQAASSGFHDLISLDMGGTSTDVCLIARGRPQLTTEFQIDGLPVRTPVLDINTVGAGGGSIVWIDEGGMLRVGPHSAGADPGPAAYGRPGGDQPTVTDAHLIRGTMRAEAFLGGRMKVDRNAAASAFQGVAERLGMSIEEAADSAISVANANIVRAIQLITTERGKDPRDYVMVAFGGAGPLHAAKVAEDLGIRVIVVPPNAGVISAYGLIASDYVQFDSLTRRAPLDAAAPDLVREAFQEMKARLLPRFEELGLASSLELSLFADMRFVGQAFEVPVEIAGDSVESLSERELRNFFTEAHQRIYFHGADQRKPVEMVSFRLGVTAPLASVPVLSETRDQASWSGELPVFEGRARQQVRVLGRGTLKRSARLDGPVLVEDATSTIMVPAGWSAEVDGAENLIMRRE